MTGRAGVAGLLWRGVPSDERRKAGVSDVDARSVVDENRVGSEKRTLFERLVEGVLACATLSEVARGLTGETTLLRRFCRLRAMGTSKSAAFVDMI